MGFISNAIGKAVAKDKAAHEAFVATPDYVADHKATQRDQARKLSEHNARVSKARADRIDAENAERAARKEADQTARMAKAVVDEILRRR